MKRNVIETDYYQIKADAHRKRLYLTIKGAWQLPGETKNYIADLEKGARIVGDGFTLLINCTMLMPFSEEVKEKVHKPAFTKLNQNGLRKSAQVMPLNYETSQQLEALSEEFGAPLIAFGDEAIAEQFLDKVDAPSIFPFS